jgi:hypothetical protein
MEYKQRVSNINYTDNLINIRLSKSEWYSVDTWIQGCKCSNTDKMFIDDLRWMFVLPMIIKMADDKIHDDCDVVGYISRNLLKHFVYSIGKIAYDFDLRDVTTIKAQRILNKVTQQINEQISIDDDWFKYNY